MLKKFAVSIILIICLACCSSSNNNQSLNKNADIKNPDEIYVIAKQYFDNKNYELSYEEFTKLKKLYPLSNEAIQAEIMIGFMSYLKMDYNSSILQFKKFTVKYPAHKDLDYVYYMIAMCNYEQITHQGLDGSFNETALSNFNLVINRFPNSKYAKDSRQKIILVKSNQAAKHLDIGRFYLKQKKYTAALNRFKIIIEDFSVTKFVPEALYRTVEAYHHMGMNEESIKVASVLGHNYPNSKWYEYSYNLIKDIEKKENLFSKLPLFN
tara:strand:- start:93 stop:893 length:801 start_codon:yes stop_codon:yes gene_type:complete